MGINEIVETLLFGFLHLLGICLVVAFILFIVATAIVVFICKKFFNKKKEQEKEC
jgi:membrane protein implicated in regulation of membrane protease activity